MPVEESSQFEARPRKDFPAAVVATIIAHGNHGDRATMSPHDQNHHELRFDVGPLAAARLASLCDAVIVVDVLSFSTAVSVATARRAVVHPFPFKRKGLDGQPSPEAYAESLDALCAGRRGKSRYSLSPPTLRNLAADDRIVLPSPNGATVSLAAAGTACFAGCLRNARAAARAAQACGRRIAVVACGERWPEDDSLRYAFEDQLGAGAILSFLAGEPSPEAAAALAVFRASEANLAPLLRACATGRALIARGFGGDVECAAELNADTAAPRLCREASGAFAFRSPAATASAA